MVSKSGEEAVCTDAERYTGIVLSAEDCIELQDRLEKLGVAVKTLGKGAEWEPWNGWNDGEGYSFVFGDCLRLSFVPRRRRRECVLDRLRLLPKGDAVLIPTILAELDRISVRSAAQQDRAVFFFAENLNRVDSGRLLRILGIVGRCGSKKCLDRMAAYLAGRPDVFEHAAAAELRGLVSICTAPALTAVLIDRLNRMDNDDGWSLD